MRGIIYVFEFTKLKRQKDVSAAAINAVEEVYWQHLAICPYDNEENGQKASAIYDYGDDYCFQIRGFGGQIEYDIWPQKSTNSSDYRPPLREKLQWIRHLQAACENMQSDRDAAESQAMLYTEVVFPKKFRNFQLEKKSKGEDLINDRFAEFRGTLQDAVYGRKKSPSKMRVGGYDERLLELLVCGTGKEKCSILRYRVR